MKFYVISQDGMRQFHTIEVQNTSKLFVALEEKRKQPHWHLGISEKGIIDTNPAYPFYIYGAKSATLVVDEDKNILYSAWKGEHTEKLNTIYLTAFKPEVNLRWFQSEYLFNFDNPMAEKTIDGISYRITQGENLELPYKLYANQNSIGEFKNMDAAKTFVHSQTNNTYSKAA